MKKKNEDENTIAEEASVTAFANSVKVSQPSLQQHNTQGERNSVQMLQEYIEMGTHLFCTFGCQWRLRLFAVDSDGDLGFDTIQLRCACNKRKKQNCRLGVENNDSMHCKKRSSTHMKPSFYSYYCHDDDC